MEILCQENYNGVKDYIFKKDNKTFRIMYGGTLDLFMQLKSSNLKEEEIGYDTFDITKENYQIYSLFDELYKDIVECNIYNISELELSWCESEREIQELYESKKERNEYIKGTEKYKDIFDGQSIIWYSDEYIRDETDILKITKEKDKYVLEFKEQSLKENISEAMRFPGLITIRLRNSGSYQDPFNIVFMRMYQKLQEYDPSYHQIHVEEYVYQKKMTKTKASNNN